MDKDTLWNKIKRVDTLSTLPEIYNKVSELIENPKTSAETLANIISRDETLTAKLLRIANSPFYKAYPEKITSITFAIALLGFNATKNLILSVSILDLFQDFEEEFKSVVRGLWTHSITCAVASKIIAQTIRYKNPEEMFVSGLLHDIGKLVELQLMPKKFKEIIELTKKDKIFMGIAEFQILKYTHTDVGKMLGSHWNLSPQIVNCIEFHHTPENADSEFQTQVAIVNIADIFAHALELGSMVPPLSEKIWESLLLKIGMIEPILQQLKKESMDAISFLFPKA